MGSLIINSFFLLIVSFLYTLLDSVKYQILCLKNLEINETMILKCVLKRTKLAGGKVSFIHCFPQGILPNELPLFKMIHVWVHDFTAARGRADGPSYHLRPCGCPWSVLLHEACWCEWPVMTLRAMMVSMVHAVAGCHGDARGLYCHQISCWGPCLCWQRRPCEYRAPSFW